MGGLGGPDRDIVSAHCIYEANVLAFHVNALKRKDFGDFRDDTVNREIGSGYLNDLNAEFLAESDFGKV